MESDFTNRLRVALNPGSPKIMTAAGREHSEPEHAVTGRGGGEQDYSAKKFEES